MYVAKVTVRLRLARSQLRGRRCRLERGVVSREPAVWRPHSHSPRLGRTEKVRASKPEITHSPKSLPPPCKVWHHLSSTPWG